MVSLIFELIVYLITVGYCVFVALTLLLSLKF
jgi:hypothetical protein